MTLDWERALADCEARLDTAEALLQRPRVSEGPRAPLPPFALPKSDQPLPAELADRARACVARGDALVVSCTEELDRIRHELRRMPRVARTERASHFEVRA